MQRGSKFSFGGALMPGWPPAPGYTVPDDVVPGAWLESFVKQNKSDPGVLTSLLTSCRAGRDQALQSASHVTLTLNTINRIGDTAAWRRRVGVLGAALQARGAKPTRLSVTYSDTRDSLRLCVLAVPLLMEAPAAFTELSLRVIDTLVDDGETIRRLMCMFTSAASQLTRLDITSPYISIPHPFHLASLKHISADLRTDMWLEQAPIEHPDSLSALAPYLPQLTSLSLTLNSPQGTLWEELFLPGVVSHSLTHFTTSTWLTDELMQRLLNHTPALKELQVGQLSLAEPVGYGYRQWGVQQLVFETGTEAEVLAGLPASTAGTVCYSMQYLMMSAVSVEGFAPDIRALLPTWRIQAGTVVLTVDAALLPHEQPPSLRNTLTQLGSGCLAAGTELHLLGWPCTAVTMQVLAECVPALAQQGHTVLFAQNAALTDDLLSAVVSVGAPLQCEFDFDSIDLQSDQHSGAVWPWVQRLSASEVSLGMVARLPQPGGVGGPREVYCDYLVIDESVREVDMAQLKSRLSHIRWSARQKAVQIRVSGFDADTPLPSQLSFLHALRFASTDDRQAAHLCLTGLTMTHDTVQALTALPRLGGTLHLAGCTWLLEPAQYTQLAQTVSVSYSKWRISGVPKETYVQLCEGIRRGREGEGLGPVTLVWSEVTEVDEEPIDLTQLLGPQGVGMGVE